MKTKSGFTLIEVMMALVILSVAILGLASATGRFIHTATVSDLQAAAIQLADDRINMVQMDPDYNGLDTTYAGTESNFPTLTGFTRQTIITRVGGFGASMDHKKITVIVNGPTLKAPITRSTTVAAP